jgi:hypothetical protein
MAANDSGNCMRARRAARTPPPTSPGNGRGPAAVVRPKGKAASSQAKLLYSRSYTARFVPNRRRYPDPVFSTVENPWGEDREW